MVDLVAKRHSQKSVCVDLYLPIPPVERTHLDVFGPFHGAASARDAKAPFRADLAAGGLDDLKAIVDGLSEQLKTLTKTVQANNIINSEQPAKPVQTAADILASIINPYTSKGEK